MIPSVKLTSKGEALLAKVPAGAAVPVTKWQIGTGALAAGSSLDRTALVAPLKDLPISSVGNEGNTATILGQFTNAGMEAFSFEELGLLATDPDEGEVLFCYGNAFGAGEKIQAGTDQLREFIFGTELTFSREANVTAVIQQALVFIPQSEKGQPGGVASLGEDGKVPEEQLPEMEYEAAGSVQQHDQDPTAHPDIRAAMLTTTVQVTYNGAQPANPVAVHNAAPLSHQNLYVDGNNVTSADNSATLEEHMANPMAHQNLVIDGNAGQ